MTTIFCIAVLAGLGWYVYRYMTKRPVVVPALDEHVRVV